MKSGKLTFRSYGDALALAVAVTVSLIGVGVIAGWHLHLRALVQVVPGVIPMQYNTALCFLVLGASAALFVTGRASKIFTAAGGAFVAVMGALVIFQYQTGISLGIDTAFFYPWERTLSADPGRMALTTAISFLLAGGAISLLALRPRTLIVFVIAHTLPLSFGLTSLIGYLLGITYVLPFLLGSQMAVHTAFAFTIYGGAMIAYAWRRAPQAEDGLPRWIPGIAAMMVPLLFVAFSSAFQSNSVVATAGQILFALAGAALLGFAVHKLNRSRIFYKGLILIAIPLAFLLTFIVLATGMKRSSEQAQARSLHSKEVIGRADDLSRRLVEAESSIRGYVITGDPAYAEPYRSDVQKIPEDVSQLRTLVSYNPEQSARAIRLGEKVAERMNLMAEIEQLVREGRRDEAVARVESGAGKRVMDEFNREMNSFLAEEERLDRVRQEELQNSWQNFDWLLTAGASAVILLAFTLALLFTRGIGRRLQTLTQNARALAEGKELAAPLKGSDEIAHLDQVFHQMAGSLRQAHDELERRVAERTAELVTANEHLRKEIVERERAEQSQQESEMRFRSAFDFAPIGMALISPDGCWMQVNQSLCEIVGYTAEELLATDFRFITHPDNIAASNEFQRRMLAGEIKTCQIEKRYIHKLGHEVWVLTGVSLVRDGQNNPLYFISQIQDITERKQAEEAIRESEERYRLLGEGILHQVWTARPDGELDYVNRRTLEYFGRTMEQMLGGAWLDAVHTDDVPACVERWTRSLQTGEYYEVEFRLRREDGEYRWHLGRATAGCDREGKIVKWFGTNTDINDQKLAEEALRASEEHLRQSQKLEAVGQLAGGIAHDFNNLLTAINGYSDLSLRRLTPGDPLYCNLEEIKRAGERAAVLTRQLLAFSRKQVLQPKVMDVNSVVSDIDKMLRRLIGEDINILTVLDPALCKVKADAGQIEQVIMNLAVNARDAMPEGGKLTIKTANVELSEAYARHHISVEPGSYMMLAVSDTGCGMDAETQKQIFEPFFTTKEVGKGTGLGLAMVYGIVKQSGGNIWVYSEVGRGTTFKIYLPQVNEAPEIVAEVEPRAAIPRGSETILLVEDEETVRELLREVLEAEGYTVLKTGGGAEALQLCQGYPNTIHLMLTDVVMPQMSGHEVAERAAALRPEMKTLYMSGYTDEAIVHHGVLDAGVAFLEKPFTPDSVARKVREVLGEPQKIYDCKTRPLAAGGSDL